MRSLFAKTQVDIGVRDPWNRNTFLLLNAQNPSLVREDRTGFNSTTVTGTITSSSSPSKFNLSIRKNTGANYIVVGGTGNANLTMGTGNFTIETWIYADAAPGSSNYALFSFTSATSGTGRDVFLFQGNAAFGTGYKFGMYDGTSWPQHSTVMTSGTWHHVAASRVSGVLYLSLDGQVENKGSYTKNMNATTSVRVGSDGNNEHNWGFNIDDLRVTKGVGRYTSNFPLPAGPFGGNPDGGTGYDAP